MIQISFNKQMLNFKGDPDKMTLAEVLGEFLATETKGNTLKVYSWIMKLAAKQPLELDEADYQTLKGLVESSERLFVISKAQILEVIIAAKEQVNSQPDHKEKVHQ